MNKYQYRVLKYVHDQVTGEFVNIGIVIYSQDSKFLRAKFINKYSRLSSFFIELNGKYILSLLRNLESKINDSNISIYSFNNLKELTESFLPEDSSTLQFSEVKMGILPPFNNIEKNKAFEQKLENLYERLVSKYMEEKEERKDDSYVWKHLYKKYFDNYKITDKLKKHTISTNNDNIEFTKAWKNGVWHCYQPLSFDLKSNEKIKHKAYQWESILRELDTANEEIKVFLLTSMPHDKSDLKKFVENKLKDLSLNNVKVKFIEEQDAEELALEVKREMEHSSN